MSVFVKFVEFLEGIGLLVTAITTYLVINKLWSRKGEKEVAASISISAALLGLATGIPFLVDYTFIDHRWAAAGTSTLGIVKGLVYVLVGAGIWVQENRGVGFFTLFVHSLKVERKESGNLVKALTQPKGARQLMEIFRAMAEVDKNLDEREIELMRLFAQRWHVDLPDLKAGDTDRGSDLLQVRRSVEAYLAVSPPAEQARELVDVLQLFVQADEKVTREEELMMEEIAGMTSAYAGEAGGAMHEVVIVPQDAAQTDAVRSLLPGVEPKRARGGRVFAVGRFFSPRYADMVCEKYIALGLFTARVEAP